MAMPMGGGAGGRAAVRWPPGRRAGGRRSGGRAGGRRAGKIHGAMACFPAMAPSSNAPRRQLLLGRLFLKVGGPPFEFIGTGRPTLGS